MKRLMLVCLLGASAPVFAQTYLLAASEADSARLAAADAKLQAADAQMSAADAKLSAADAKTRAELDAARARLDKAAREVAEISMRLGGPDSERREIRIINGGPNRAILGVNIDPDSGKEGARVRNVSPGGPAAEAGLQTGDVIVALDGKPISGGDKAGITVIETMRGVKADQKVKVRVLRAGKNKDYIVVARPMAFGPQNFAFTTSDMDIAMTAPRAGMAALPQIHQFRTFFPGEFAGLELTKITPKLGAYFGTTEGVLVVQAPDNDSFKFEDGDVIQTIDGRKPSDGAHALRILRSYKAGEKLSVAVLRQKKPLTLAVTMPERGEFEEDRFFDAVAAPPEPPEPPTPGVAPAPGSGTLD